jgi:hypothetical protein
LSTVHLCDRCAKPIIWLRTTEKSAKGQLLWKAVEVDDNARLLHAQARPIAPTDARITLHRYACAPNGSASKKVPGTPLSRKHARGVGAPCVMCGDALTEATMFKSRAADPKRATMHADCERAATRIRRWAEHDPDRCEHYCALIVRRARKRRDLAALALESTPVQPAETPQQLTLGSMPLSDDRSRIERLEGAVDMLTALTGESLKLTRRLASELGVAE